MLRFALRFLIAADGKHTAVFALRAGVGLEGNCVKAGDGFQAVFHIGEQFAVAHGLRFGSVGMDVGELGPSNRQHFRSRIELHGAATERNHAAVHRQVAVFEFFQVAQHFVFGVVTVEHRMLQNVVLTQQFCIQTAFDIIGKCERILAGKRAVQICQIFAHGCFVEGGGDLGIADAAQVVTRFQSNGKHLVCFLFAAEIDGNGIEEDFVNHIQTV